MARLLLPLLLTLRVMAVKELATHKEYTALMKDADEAGLPVILDYYSDSCGPCRMIAPVFSKMAREFSGKAYFRKVDINRNRQTASHHQISSMPTFQFFLNGKKRNQFSGADERSLRDWTTRLVNEAAKNNFVVTREALEEFYQKHDPAKATPESLAMILKKNSKNFGTMVDLLKKKYGEGPKTTPRPSPAGGKGPAPSSKGGGKEANEEALIEQYGQRLKRASLDDLKEELAEREEDAQAEEERKLAYNPCSITRNRTDGLVEKVVIIGGGPSGMTAAIYAARANLCPLIIAPALGGQLMSKGVDVENYPGMPREQGPRIVEVMRQQARTFFAEIWDDSVLTVDTSSQPFEIMTNSSGSVKAHTIILATGADSKWLDATGEYEYRGHGVSSCAACDGSYYNGKPCAVIGGGDTAVEEALMLSRICSKVTLVHRRAEFRASQVLQQRLFENDRVEVRTNAFVAAFVGNTIERDGEESKFLTHLELNSTEDPQAAPEILEVDAAFVAIGHNPNTEFLRDRIEMDKTGYLSVMGRSTVTTVPGIFAAGDVADYTYRQAVTSAGSGAMAALDAERYLSEHPVEEKSCVRQEDFSTWSVKELRAQMDTLGLKCAGCTDKSEFVATLRVAF